MPIPFAKGSLVTAAVAAAAFWLARGDQEPEPTAVPSATDSPATGDATGTPAVERRPVATETAAAEKLRELQASSETFRNTTFLIAIRDAGYVCTELRDVYGGVNNSHTWTATCADMLAYTVSVTDAGALAVEPMLHHLDGAPTRPIDGGRERLGPPRTIPLEPPR